MHPPSPSLCALPHPNRGRHILAAWVALQGGACGGEESEGPAAASGDVIEYELSLAPLTPSNQTDLFTDIEKLSLLVEPAVGEPVAIELSDWSSGGYDQATELPALEDATVALMGEDADGNTIAWGRTLPLSLSEGTLGVSILVGRVHKMGWLADLEDRHAAGALVADGTGRFLLFGGSEDGLYGDSSGMDTVLAIDVGAPKVGLSFAEVGTMPPIYEDQTGRVGHSATLLTGQHADQGKILVAGGASDYQGGQDASDNVFLWDPALDTYEELGRAGELPGPMFHHIAVEDASGQVVLVGGSGWTNGQGISASGIVAVYDPNNSNTVAATGNPRSPMLMHGAARLGTEGVLTCGGVEFAASGYGASDVCDLISTAGAIEGGYANMPMPMLHMSLAPLDSGGVLLTGGFVVSGNNGDDDQIDASNRAFVFEGGAWTEVGNMANPRAMHSSALLPDGRVLVVGGVIESDTVFWNGQSGLACAEYYDPTDKSFHAVDACTEADTSASLADRAAFPMAAVDPDRGAAVVGGLGDNNGVPIKSAAFYMVEPAE